MESPWRTLTINWGSMAGGRSRFTVVRVEKDGQVTVVTGAPFTQENVSERRADSRQPCVGVLVPTDLNSRRPGHAESGCRGVSGCVFCLPELRAPARA